VGVQLIQIDARGITKSNVHTLENSFDYHNWGTYASRNVADSKLGSFEL
jgi:hypothetical protein